jgi:hypothetical protein
MAKGLVLRVVPLLCGDKRRVEWLVPLLCGDKAGTSPLLCGDKPPAVRGQAPCCAGTSPLLCGDKPPALRGRAPRWTKCLAIAMGLAHTQVGALATEPAPR